MQVEQIDRDAATDSELFPCPACFGKDELAPSCSICSGRGIVADPEAFARHRQQARAEVVGEIVAMLDERISVYEQKRDKADPLADETYNRHEAITYVLEALEIVKLGVGKFGGRDAD